MMQYDEVIQELRQAYNLKVEERDQKQIDPWKVTLRDHFLELLQAEHKQTLLEIGAGTGVHGQFFQDNGLTVTCTDLSPAMVERCREKGLTAYVQDFLHLDFSGTTFDSVFAMNCLLHVPQADLAPALKAIRSVMKPDGLFFLGQHGGENWAGVYKEDHYEPQRFFSMLSDSTLKDIVGKHFTIEEFSKLELAENDRFHFQALILRNPA
jgi:SAM-dependent methyltransferase